MRDDEGINSAWKGCYVRKVSCGAQSAEMFRWRKWNRDRPEREGRDRPTLDEASVSEFRVEDFPALGFPTRPINGSLGILKRLTGGRGGRFVERVARGRIGLESLEGHELEVAHACRWKTPNTAAGN